jgi:predicted dehydrogenase
MNNNRRNALKSLGSLAAIGLSTSFTNDQQRLLLESTIKYSSNDTLQIGLIGCGIIGHYDTDVALKIPGVRLVAVCDLYDGRLVRAKEKWGNDLFTTKDYRELLARPTIDAVLICTPDHWHQKIAIDAMNAGKHVYCEKPMVQKIEQGHAIIATQKKTNRVFQVGSQRASSVAILEAKKLYEKGVIGTLTHIEAFCDRSDSMGAWAYSIPTDASPETVDFDRFLGNVPKRPFDAKHFFRWRNYKDYSTGAAGDLIVHLLTGIHVITDSIGPETIYSLADLKLWKDGRNSYDVVNALMNYTTKYNKTNFTTVTRTNLANGEGKGEFGIKLFGTEGVLDIGWNTFTLKTIKRPTAPGYGGYDSFDSFSAQQKIDFKKWYEATYGNAAVGLVQNTPIPFAPEKGYDDRLDHMIVFINAIREGGTVVEDASFGFRAAAPSIACNLSTEQKKVIHWNPEKMLLV